MIGYFKDNLKCICASSISCSFNGYYVLEAKFGKITFNFPIEIKIAKLHFKRLSGNGKILINNSQDVIISKNLEIKNVIDFNGDICISRPLDSIGEVALIGIEVHLKEEEKEGELINWKAVVKSFKNYKGLSLVNNNLLASEGAFIEPQEMVKDLVTEPANVFSRKDSRLVFNYSCKIISLKVDKSFNLEEGKPFIEDRASPFPASPTVEESLKVTNLNQESPVREVRVQNKNLDLNSIKVIYDSDPVKGLSQFYHRNNKSLKFINTNNKHHIVLKPKTTISIPISGIELNKKYILIISGKKINGNGKVRAALSSNLASDVPAIIFSGMNEEVTFHLECKDLNDLKINVGMLDDSIGEVIISRIILIKDLEISNFNYSSNYLNFNNVFTSSNLELVSSPQNYHNINKLHNSSYFIKKLCKDSAWITVKSKDRYFNIDCNIKTLCYSSRQYIANLASYINGIKVIDPFKLIDNVNYAKENEKETLAMGSLGNLTVSNRLYIEEWSNDESPSQYDLNIIKDCQNVLTTSNYNYVYLKTLFPQKSIQVIKKPRIHLNSISVNKINYFIYLEKDVDLTKKLINFWKNKKEKLYIVGTNLNVSENVEKISEYSDYEKIYSLIANAEYYIDFNKNNQYNSSWIDLAKNLGCKIITNNIQNINYNYGYLNLNKNFDLNSEELDYAIAKAKLFEINNINSELEFKKFLIG